jgi:hypothetical protein
MQLWLMQRDLLTPSTMPTTVSTLTCNTRLPHFGQTPWIVIMLLPPNSLDAGGVDARWLDGGLLAVSG